ncbi:hypothetical protein Daus18300_004832 [Diaporthe australafricana]|uniref:Major facilitator superfamily (MFS) profile domain-containing protein n=1 Tax=Diaporthe australafricana TaxID=127596 RepID=A0ABR3X5Y3_9PEZI
MDSQNRSITGATTRPSEDECSKDGRARANSGDYDESMSESSISDVSMSSNLESPRQEEVTWASLPKKGQLAVIVLVRLAEPLTERSLTSYIFYQLRWFDQSLDESSVVYRAGLLTAVFAAAQCATAMLWGHAADNPRFGRKGIIMVGLIGSSMSSIGMGLTTSFAGAVGFRIMAGLLNGNIGVLRTMVSEIVDDRR